MRQSSRRKSYLAPVTLAECIRQPLAVEADLPGKQTVGLKRPPRVFSNGGSVNTGKRSERELTVVVEMNKLIVLFGKTLRLGFIYIGDVLDEELPIGLKERAHVIRERVNSLASNQAVGVVAPAESGRQCDENEQEQQRQSDTEP
jgi:hypothetical protein